MRFLVDDNDCDDEEENSELVIMMEMTMMRFFVTRSRICSVSTRLISHNYKLRGEETLNFVQIVQTLN